MRRVVARVAPGVSGLLLLAVVAAGDAPAEAPPAFWAELLALRDVDVPAEIAGRVSQRPDDETVAVNEGAVVVALDDALLVQAARGAAAEVERVRARREWARLELDRERALAERGSSERAALDRAVIGLREADAALQVAEAAAAGAEERLARCRIRAPFAGRLVRVPPERGEFLRVGETAFRIVDDSRLRVVAYVGGANLAGLEVGQRALVTTDAGAELEARVFSIAPAAQGPSRTFRVEARMDRAAGLRPGMTARIGFVRAP